MNIRIISGEFGGRTIEGSGTDRTHPMGERIRNAMFNKIGDEIVGTTILDAFAGSGAIGLEALSRGASKVIFVENDRVAQKIIQNNINRLGVADRAKLIKTSVSSWQKTTQNETFDMIFADPPYHNPQLSTAFSLLDLLHSKGLMILSYSGRGELPAKLGYVVVDDRNYGNANLAFYRKK